MKSRFHPGLCVGLVAAGLALLPAAAQAQTADPGAPAAGTPPANQYQIPLQAGRRDAAPPKAQRNPNPNSGSLYRTDNNFGSSSVIPGDPRSGGGDGGAGGAGGAGGTGDKPADSGSGAGSGPRSESGSGTPDDGGGLDTGAPSEVAAYTTLPLIVLLGAVIGVAGVRMRRRAEL
jgi:hypothetical protein